MKPPGGAPGRRRPPGRRARRRRGRAARSGRSRRRRCRGAARCPSRSAWRRGVPSWSSRARDSSSTSGRPSRCSDRPGRDVRAGCCGASAMRVTAAGARAGARPARARRLPGAALGDAADEARAKATARVDFCSWQVPAASPVAIRHSTTWSIRVPRVVGEDAELEAAPRRRTGMLVTCRRDAPRTVIAGSAFRALPRGERKGAFRRADRHLCGRATANDAHGEAVGPDRAHGRRRHGAGSIGGGDDGRCGRAGDRHRGRRLTVDGRRSVRTPAPATTATSTRGLRLSRPAA